MRPTAAAPGWCCGSTSSTRRCRPPTPNGERPRIVLLSPTGRLLDDELADELTGEPHVALLCGRYEGFDERVHEHLADDEVSIGRYVLAGGELPAMVVADVRDAQAARGARARATAPSRSPSARCWRGCPSTRTTPGRRSTGAGRCPRSCSPATTSGCAVAARAEPRAGRAVRVGPRSSYHSATARRPTSGPGGFFSPNMSSVIDSIERRQLRQGLPSFGPGDRVRVHFQVIEGSRRRTQVFEGIVLRRQGSGVARDLHRPQAVLRRRRGADVPAALAEDREARDRGARRRAPGQALLPARPDRQGRPRRRAALGHRRGARLGADRGRASPRRSTPRASTQAEAEAAEAPEAEAPEAEASRGSRRPRRARPRQRQTRTRRRPRPGRPRTPPRRRMPRTRSRPRPATPTRTRPETRDPEAEDQRRRAGRAGRHRRAGAGAGAGDPGLDRQALPDPLGVDGADPRRRPAGPRQPLPLPLHRPLDRRHRRLPPAGRRRQRHRMRRPALARARPARGRPRPSRARTSSSGSSPGRATRSASENGHPVVNGVEKTDEPYINPCGGGGACNLPQADQRFRPAITS